MTPFHNASTEIQDAWAADRSEELDREYTEMPLQIVDELISDLEECNLDGRQRVPDSMAPQLETLARLIPERYGAELRIRVAISRLMDHLYDVAQYLLDLKIGDRSTYDSEDRAAEQSQAQQQEYPAAS